MTNLETEGDEDRSLRLLGVWTPGEPTDKRPKTIEAEDMLWFRQSDASGVDPMPFLFVGCWSDRPHSQSFFWTPAVAPPFEPQATAKQER